MKQALVYDRVNKIGGAERVLVALHEMYPESPLFTAVYNLKTAPWAETLDVRPSFMNKFPLASTTHELYPWLTPLAFESFNFDEFDIVVSVTSAEAKGILSKPNTLHVCYCLTPTRYLWKDHELYLNQIPFPLKQLAKPVFAYMRQWDKVASQRPDYFITISNAVKERVKKNYNIDSEVVYPPIDIKLTNSSVKNNIELPFEEYFLIVSRLVAHKRVELAVKACNKLKLPLVIVGTGMLEKKLKNIAGPTIRFVGKLTQLELIVYYQNCRALLFPQEEDFGISAVEAQAAGKPVIAYNKGGAKEIILRGKTGLFFSKQSETSIIKAINSFNKIKFDSIDCKNNAKRFSKDKFINNFSKAIERLWQEHKQKNER